MRRISGALLAILLLAANSGTAVAQRREQLDAAQRKWRSARVTGYRYRLDVLCYCIPFPRPVTVDVQGRAVAQVVYADSGTAADTSRYVTWLTVERTFAWLGGVIERNPHGLEVTYDPELGFPASVAIDPNPATRDDELTVRLTQFTRRR